MTISIQVKNIDSRETAIVKVDTVDTKSDATSKTVELKGGEAAECLVHADQYLRVVEVRNG